MKTLILLRHGKAEPSEMGRHDHDRALATRGMANVQAQARHHTPHDGDYMLISSALRTCQTAEILLGTWNDMGHEILPEMHITQQVYLAPAEIWVDLAAMVPDKCNTLWVIGHNPGLSELVTELTGQYLGMATADAVHISLDIENWSALSARCGTVTLHRSGRTA